MEPCVRVRMTVSVDRPTGGNRTLDRAGVPPDIFTHTGRTLSALHLRSQIETRRKVSYAAQSLNTRSRNKRLANNLNSVAHRTHQGVWPIAWIISSLAWTYSSCDRRRRDLASNS